MDNDDLDKYRLKAYLSFDEEDEVKKNKNTTYDYVYYNSKGDPIKCRIIIRRKNGEIVVENTKGARVCLTEKELREDLGDERS
jgi:hypothetical protein